MIGWRYLITDRAAVAASALLILQAVVYYGSSAKEVLPSVAPWRLFPTEVNGWTSGPDLSVDPAVLKSLKPDDYVVRDYTSPDARESVGFFIVYFNSRRDGRAPHSPQWCLPGAGWKSVSTRDLDIAIPGQSEKLHADEYLIEMGRDREFVLYWYHQAARTVSHELTAQLYSLPDLIFHGRTDTALVRIIVPVGGSGVDAARVTAIGFAQSVYPLIRKRIS